MRRLTTAQFSRIDTPAEVMRPFVWVAGVFFTLGYCGYFAVSALAG